MGNSKTLVTIFYLLLYSCFFTVTNTTTDIQEIQPKVVAQVEKGLELTKDLLSGLDELGKWIKESKNNIQTIQKVLKVFDVFGKIASSFGFIGAFISLILAFIPQADPTMEFLKEQFTEVNRKLDSLSSQMSTLQTEMEWTSYASEYGKDESAIRNSWAKLQEFMDKSRSATTAEQKTRLAEQFTSFYTSTGTEGSVANLYRYITEHNPSSLNKNLLQLVTEKSNGDFKILTQYSSYFTTLMVSGLQMNVFFYKLKGYDAEAKAKEASTLLSDVLLAIQDSLIQCANDFQIWAKKDAEKFATEVFSDTKQLTTDLKKQLEEKFFMHDWIVIAHSKDARYKYTFGQSISLIVQGKTMVHLIHREKKAIVDQTIVAHIKSKWSEERFPLGECETVEGKLLQIFGIEAVKHIKYLHALRRPDDYAQTSAPDVVLNCAGHVSSELIGNEAFFSDHERFSHHRIINIYLKSKEVVENPPCSKVKCLNGECKPITDSTLGICRCHKMYRGSTCDVSIQNEIDYAAIELKINEVIYQPVPDLTAIFYSIEEMKDYTRKLVEALRDDIEWTQVLIKYYEIIQKFRYIATFHMELGNNTIPQSKFISEVGAQFQGGNTFIYCLTEFNHMMMGTGFGDKHTILDVFRNSINLECTQIYRDKIDYFVRLLFTLEKEAVLAWQKYLVIKGNTEDIKTIENLVSKFVEAQWALLNKNGCGPLTAKELDNHFCEKTYHSTNQLKVNLKCLGEHRPYPETVQCSNGKWSGLPLCFAEQVNGRVECSSEAGATSCKASCSKGWDYIKPPSTTTVRCTQQPCSPFLPEKCLRCTDNSVCKDHEVCEVWSGECRDGCKVAGCGVNAECSYSKHQRTCTCVPPWKGNPDYGCKSQDLEWVHHLTSEMHGVVAYSGMTVCRAIGPDGGMHSGYLQGGPCHYEYDWKDYEAKSYEILADPCSGNGYKWVDGMDWNAVVYAESIRFPGVKYYVCSAKKNNMPGKLFNTRHGFMCHIPVRGDTRHDQFYSLVPKPCI